jgi:GNAT superfamily N-acetyltransferase
LSELRPHLSKNIFLETVRRLSDSNNFKFAYILDGSVKAVAGFRIAEWLYSRYYLEIEDLITSEKERSKGYGGKLIDWLYKYASERNCQQLRLVSGVARESAHRFYLRKGMGFEGKCFTIRIE